MAPVRVGICVTRGVLCVVYDERVDLRLRVKNLPLKQVSANHTRREHGPREGHTLNVLLQDSLKIHVLAKRFPGCPQTPRPREIGTHPVILFQVVLRKSRRRAISIAGVCQVEHTSSAETTFNLPPARAPLALDADHLRLLGDADLISGDQMNKDSDAAWEVSLGIRDGGRVVGNEKPKFEFWVVVEDMVMLQTKGCSIAICCSRPFYKHTGRGCRVGIPTHRQYQRSRRVPSSPLTDP